MVTQQTRPRRRDTYTRSGMAAAAALLLGLGGCNPIDTYRHWTGISANDPNPATTPNTGNLAAGEAKSYPNLATVPPPPTQALTTAELNKLTQSLIADRANAKYTSEQLQAKFDEAAAPPPPPPAAPAAGETKPASVTLGAAGAAAPAVAPAPGNTPAHQAPPAANPAPGPSASAGNGEKGAPRAGQPPEPGPMESPLQSPQIAALPQPEQSRPAPPPPRLLSAPSGPAIGTAPGAHLPAPPAPIGSGQPQAAPAAPSLPPPAAVQTATAAVSPRPAKTPAPPAAFVSLASVTFPADATAVTEADRQTLARIVARYRQTPGLLKVVGHANVGSTAAQQLDSYRVALDRAQAVADALRKAGIPANKLQVEAVPTSGDAAAQGRADILLAQ